MISILLTILIGYLLLCGLVFIFQSRLVYFPDKQLPFTPAAIGLSYDDIRFMTADNLELNGWYIFNDYPIGTLLFCHGNAGNIGHRLASIKIFHDLGLNVFIFDYRGYGKSEGSINESGSSLDARAAWDFLTQTRHIPPGQIVLFGRSLGSAVAAELGRSVSAAGIILESSFRSIPDLGQQLYPFLPVKLLSRVKYPTSDYLQQVGIPKLFIHSRNDEIIPFSHGEYNYSHAPAPKAFLEISGGHNDGFMVSRAVYEKGLRQFLSGLKLADTDR